MTQTNYAKLGEWNTQVKKYAQTSCSVVCQVCATRWRILNAEGIVSYVHRLVVTCPGCRNRGLLLPSMSQQVVEYLLS